MSPEERLRRILRYLAGDDELPSWMHQQTGWAQSGPLYTFSGAYGNQNPVKLIVEKFDRSAVYTAQIGLNVGDTTAPVQAIAEVVWSINGTPVRRVVSVSQGCSISGVTESARVTIYDDTPAIEGQENVQREYVALANVAVGQRGATTLPPFLRVWSATQALNASASTAVQVPFNAGVVGLRTSVAAAGNAGATVTMTDSQGTIYDQYVVSPGENAEFVPLAPGTTIVTITNNDSANPIYISGQWAIDG